MHTWRDDFALLRERSFALFFVARLCSTFGGSFAPVALAFAVLHLPKQGSPELLSIVLAFESVPMLVFMLVGGVLADHFPRRSVLIVGELLAAAAFASLGATMLVGFTPLWALAAGAALSGISIAVIGPVLTGILPELIGVADLKAGNALLGLGSNAGRVIGVVVAGAAVALFGGPTALLGAAGLFGLSGLLALGLPLRAGRDQSLSASGMLTDLRDGWREFVSHEWLWVVVLQWSFLVFVFNGAHGVLGPVIADAELGGPVPWSWILAGESGGAVIGVLIAMRMTPRRPILLPVVLTTIFLPLPFLFLGLGLPLPLVIATACTAGASMSIFGVLWTTTMQREVPAESLSRVSSYDALGSFMFGPLGLLVAGPLAAIWGARQGMLAAGVALIVICAAAVLSRDVRRLSWHAPAAPASSIPALPEELP